VERSHLPADGSWYFSLSKILDILSDYTCTGILPKTQFMIFSAIFSFVSQGRRCDQIYVFQIMALNFVIIVWFLKITQNSCVSKIVIKSKFTFCCFYKESSRRINSLQILHWVILEIFMMQMTSWLNMSCSPLSINSGQVYHHVCQVGTPAIIWIIKVLFFKDWTCTCKQNRLFILYISHVFL